MGELGRALAESGREAVAPLIVQVIVQAQAAGDVAPGDPADLVALYLDLLVGDLQIRRAIGVIPALGVAHCQTRADRALRRFLHLAAT